MWRVPPDTCAQLGAIQSGRRALEPQARWPTIHLTGASSHVLPGVADDVVIAIGTGVVHDGGTTSVLTVTTSQPLTISGESVAVAGAFICNGATPSYQDRSILARPEVRSGAIHPGQTVW